MKITGVHLTLFGWDDIPATRYGIHTGTFSGACPLTPSSVSIVRRPSWLAPLNVPV